MSQAGALGSSSSGGSSYNGPGAIQNVAMTYDAVTGTFTVGPNSSGTMTLNFPSNVDGVSVVTVTTASTFSFTDSTLGGGGDLSDARFGFGAFDVQSSPYPFFLYAVLDVSDSNLRFLVSALPGRANTNAFGVSSIIQGSVNVNTWAKYFGFGNISNAPDYDNCNLVYIGCFQMQLGATGFIVQPLYISGSNGFGDEGVGKSYQNTQFLFSPGTLLSAANSCFIASGTAPTILDGLSLYWYFNENHDLVVDYRMTIDASGTGVTVIGIALPMVNPDSAIYAGYYPPPTIVVYNTPVVFGLGLVSGIGVDSSVDGYLLNGAIMPETTLTTTLVVTISGIIPLGPK